jgi:hypothetical protein
MVGIAISRGRGHRSGSLVPRECAKWLFSGPAWREVEFALRYRVSNSPVKSAIFLSRFLRLWLQTPCQAQVRLCRRHTTTCFFWRCRCHDNQRLLMASEMPLGSPVPFTSFTTHPGRGCTAATGPCQQPAHDSMPDHQLRTVGVHSFQSMGKLYS